MFNKKIDKHVFNTIKSIRLVNIYTTRGVYLDSKNIQKKEGRISEYF